MIPYLTVFLGEVIEDPFGDPYGKLGHRDYRLRTRGDGPAGITVLIDPARQQGWQTLLGGSGSGAGGFSGSGAPSLNNVVMFGQWVLTINQRGISSWINEQRTTDQQHGTSGYIDAVGA